MQRNAVVSRSSFFGYLRLTRFSKPAHLRPLYREIVQTGARRIVELGLGNGARAQHMIALAQRSGSDKPLRYTGIDLFESRANGNSFSLKKAHSLLHSTDYEVRLVPGDPATALARCANELRGTDIVVISSDITESEVQAAWHLLPRMLHKDSKVWIERGSARFDVLGPAELRARPKRRAA